VTASDRIVLPRVQRAERRLLRNIQYVSIGVAVLYLFGFIWRSSYYSRLGIPQSLIDFPFPEILVPKSLCIVIFIVSILSPFASRKFSDFFVETRRDFVNKTFGLKCPMKEVIQYLGQKSADSKYNTNYEAILGATTEYISERTLSKNDFTKEAYDELYNFLRTKIVGLSREMKDSVISFVKIMALEDDVRDDVIKFIVAASTGKSPKGYYIPTKIYWFIQIMIAGFLLLSGFYWGHWQSLGALILGNILGLAVYRCSYVENRVQFWMVLLICFSAACGVQFGDAQLSAYTDMQEGRFPVVLNLPEIYDESQGEIKENQGKYTQGLFLGYFKGKYIFSSIGKFDWPNLIIVDGSHIKELRLVYKLWMKKGFEKSIQQLKSTSDRMTKEVENLRDQLKEVEKRQGTYDGGQKAENREKRTDER